MHHEDKLACDAEVTDLDISRHSQLPHGFFMVDLSDFVSPRDSRSLSADQRDKVNGTSVSVVSSGMQISESCASDPRWHDVLVEFPNSLKSIKPRRKPNYVSNKENVQPPQDEGPNKEVITGRFEVEKVRQQQQLRTDLPAYATFKGVRSLKHKYDKNYQEGMRKSSSLHDLSSEDKTAMASSLASTRFLSCSGDQLDVLSSGGGGVSKTGGRFSTNPYFTIPRTSWPSRVHPAGPLLTAPAAHPSLFNSSSSISSTSSTNSATRRGSFDDRPPSGAKPGKERVRHGRERSASLKDFPTVLTLPRDSGSLENVDGRSASVAGVPHRVEADDLSQSMSADETDSNETDELKDLVYMKKGWLIKQGPSDRESRKHWFVLAGNSLRYYKDAKAEESNNLDGRIDLSTCYEVSEITTARNYGFKIKTRNGEYVLAAMTSGIRNNWMKAVRLCMDLHSSAPKLGLSTALTGKALADLTARTVDDFAIGSDSIVVAPSLQASDSRRSKRNITSESNKEEEKREMMRRAKSPSARIKEKSRAAKTPRLHSPPPEDDGYEQHRSSGTGRSADTSQALSDMEDDMDMTISSEEHYLDSGAQDTTDGAHSDSIGDGMLVEILESEVESLKERLDQTQNQLVKMHETNIDLKSRLQKESSQTLKRQLKDAKDTVQKQRMEIDSLKSKLDMSVSKLTGTEKALSEALREYKQEKDKFLKLSSEWNRRIRTLEGQVKDSTHKLERARESMLTKEREARRLETEVKQHQQKTREQDREILKLKAVEHEYNQLKERLDNKERDLLNAHAELREKDSHQEKMKAEFEQQMAEVEREFGQERDDLENHLEELKEQLRSSQERQSTMQDNITTNMADLLGEKDDIISQLEEKLIEHDHKMVDMQEELQAEMSENSELMQNLEVLQEEKQNLQDQISAMEKQVVSLREKVSSFEKDNTVLRQQLEKLKQENSQLSARLSKTPSSKTGSDPEKEELQKTIHDLNKQVQGLQLKLMEKFEDFDQTKDSDLLQSILVVDSELKEVNTLLMQLHQRFTDYMGTVSGGATDEASSLVEMVDEIGHRCLVLQETLQEGVQGMLPDESGSDYRHEISVDPSSSSQVILEEYRGLKNKFDRVVAELKKLKKEVNEVYSSYEQLERKDKQLEEKMQNVEGAYRQQVDNLVQRVEQLSSQLATSHSTAALQARLQQQPAKSPGMSGEIEKQLSQLDSKINVMEKALAEAHAGASPKSPDASARLSLSPQDSQAIVGRLQSMKQQLETTNCELKDIIGELPKGGGGNPASPGHQQALVSRIDGCGKKLDKLTNMIQEEGDSSGAGENPGRKCSGGGCPDSDASSMAKCMHDIKESIQEIGELLDCLEDEGEDSDDEDGDGTTIEDVRERLASLCEYVKQHSQFSDYDWRLTQLLMAQKLAITRDEAEDADSSGQSKSKLQNYADRLSLESLILVEMAHILENRESEEDEKDPVVHELSVLNSKVLSLQQKLDQELRTLSVEGSSTDVLRVQAELMAEKILLEGQLCSGAFGQNSHLSESDAKEEEEKKLQPKLLAAEAIMRSQLDSYIGQNLDKTCDEMWSSASHLTTRALVQGELTFALTNLKKQLSDSPHITQSVSGIRDFSFECLKQRHKQVVQLAQVYHEKMIQAFAVIISKDSEEMTIVEGPENVLDAVCSEVSTIMERHIQHYKEKVRTAKDTQSAHRWDMMVKQLRADREVVLTGIRQQHAAFASDPESENGMEVPFQSLDSSINNFGEITSLRSILCAHLDFVSELLRMGNTTLLAEMSQDDGTEEEEEEEDAEQRAIQKGLGSFVHSLAEALQSEAKSKKAQAAAILSAVPSIPHPQSLTSFNQALVREAVFAAQTTFMMYKLKLLHEQEMDALKAARPARARPQLSTEGSQEGETDLYSLIVPMEEVLDTKYDDEMETLRVIASQVGKLQGALGGRDWGQIGEHVQQLEQKVQAELGLAKQRHEVHVDLFKQEESKVEHAWEEVQQERDHFEERCLALETELRSMNIQHDDEVERMRQDVMTAVSAIRANEEQSETQLSDKVQVLTKQMLLQKEKFKRFLSKMKGELSGGDKQNLSQLVAKELKEIDDTSELSEDEELPPLPSRPPPDVAHSEDKGNLNVEEELELLKKEKDEALAEETRNTKAALDAMRKAYEEELQHERDKYREVLTTMYNEDFVNEIRRRHQSELEKVQEELKQVKMHYLSKCEDYKLLEVKMGQTKQDYESHINQLIMSNDHLDDMVNQEIERLKDFIKKKPANLTTGSATTEEELYDAQIMIRVKDAELQKLRSQVKNLENSLHRTTEALKENQEQRKEYQAETNSLREQLEKALNESGLRRPIRRNI
nr:hypothetical protein BaRGS_006662 [Batillaria attramentaria]